MNDRDLFDTLDLEQPELQAVKMAVITADYPAAKTALAQHLRQRTTPQWFFKWQDSLDLSIDDVPPEAEKILRHEITYGFHGAPDFTRKFGEYIDWGANPTEGEYGTHLWNECLNRHFHFEPLIEAYRATGEARFAEGLVHDWIDWIEHNPRPMDSSGNQVARPYGCYAWQTLTTGIRLEHVWPNALYRCLGSPAFTDEAIALIFMSFRDQARHLMQWPTLNNWLTEESMGLFTAGMLFPEFQEAPLWRKTAIERLYGQLTDEVYPDGAEYELAAGYGNWVVRNFISLLERTRLNNLTSELPNDLEARMEKMFDYMVSTAMPDIKLPGLNDSYNVDVSELLTTGHTLFPYRKDFLYLGSKRKDGTPPDRMSCGQPYSGHYVMRSGWEADALYMLMDSGPFGSAHQHEDKLHFVLHAYGKQHVLDPGNYSYDSSRWRKYVLSTPGHNTVMVDGMGQNRRPDRSTWSWPRPWTAPTPPGDQTVWKSTTAFDYVKGIYDDGYGPENDRTITHTRRVLFLKPEYWVIIDTLSSSDQAPHHYESLFHLDATDVHLDSQTLTVQTNHRDAANLSIIPLIDDVLQAQLVSGQEDPVQGWANAPWRAIPTAIYSKTASHTAQFIYALCPTRAGDKPPIVSILPVQQEYNGADISIEIILEDGRTDLFMIPEQPGQQIACGAFSTDGEFAVVRLQKDGTINQALLINGTFIQRDGHIITRES